MTTISPSFRRVLEARRELWNAEVARRGAVVPPQAMLAYLARTVGPIVDAAGEAAADAVAQALFGLGLSGLPTGLVGGAAPTPLETALVDLLPRFGEHLRGAGRRLVPAFGNGFVRMARERGAPTARWWAEALAQASAQCATFENVLAAGVVLAWRAGIAEGRAAALAHLQRMDVRLREALVGAADVDPDPVRRFAPPGSRATLGPLELLGRVGAFSGFGGDFRVPPVVRADADRLLASDGFAVRELHADVFGARLRPFARPPSEILAVVPGPATIDGDGTIRWDGLEASFPALAGATAVAAGAGMVAVTLADSHAVFVLGRRAAG